MRTTTSTSTKQSVSFRWDANLVKSLKEMAKRQNRSFSSLTEMILTNSVGTQAESEEIPNRITMASYEEAQAHQDRVAEGQPDDDNYVDMTSIDAMVKSILK